MPQTCGVVSRAESGGLASAASEPESVIAIFRNSSRRPATQPAAGAFLEPRPACGERSKPKASGEGVQDFPRVVLAEGAPHPDPLRASFRSSRPREERGEGGMHQPATCLMRAISSSTALSTGTFSLTTRFIALAQTFSLLRIVNFQFLVKSNGVVPPVN